jgi:hypothetical protein
MGLLGYTEKPADLGFMLQLTKEVVDILIDIFLG